jgi:hypothetical protein
MGIPLVIQGEPTRGKGCERRTCARIRGILVERSRIMDAALIPDWGPSYSWMIPNLGKPGFTVMMSRVRWQQPKLKPKADLQKRSHF